MRARGCDWCVYENVTSSNPVQNVGHRLGTQEHGFESPGPLCTRGLQNVPGIEFNKSCINGAVKATGSKQGNFPFRPHLNWSASVCANLLRLLLHIQVPFFCLQSPMKEKQQQAEQNLIFQSDLRQKFYLATTSTITTTTRAEAARGGGTDTTTTTTSTAATVTTTTAAAARHKKLVLLDPKLSAEASLAATTQTKLKSWTG